MHNSIRKMLTRGTRFCALWIISATVEKSGLFDFEWYQNKYPDVPRGRTKALEHYISIGRSQGKSPTLRIWELNRFALNAFDAEWYVAENNDVPNIEENPLGHYIENGHAENRAPSRKIKNLSDLANATIDLEWYAHKNPDVVREGTDLFQHYMEYGRSEGRRPSFSAAEEAVFAEIAKADFDPDLYASLNPDIIQPGVDPLRHYVEYGHAEGRPTKQDLDVLDPSPRPQRAPLRWFYIDDTVQWLNSHAHLTGVGRVTAEILLAGLFEVNAAFIPCIKDETGRGLLSLSEWGPIYKIANAVGYRDYNATDTAEHPYIVGPTSPTPMRGDHVIFTGVIWTVETSLLFRRLKAQGLAISVLIHDIIPITRPELVGAVHAQSFEHWLSATVQIIDVVYVSSQIVARDISKWLLERSRPSKIKIVQVPFGMRQFRADKSLMENADYHVASEFVLSVGTIDRRKNQRALCEAWIDLYDGMYGADLPQLVLVGRDDEQLSSEDKFVRLIAHGKLLFLDHINDTIVAELYRNCLFTVFPSTSEGYGLPVSESLSYGKLCLSSDLDVIRTHAGDFPWYFNPNCRQSMLAQINRALSSPAERSSAEIRIRTEFKSCSWASTVRSIVEISDAIMSGERNLPSFPTSVTSAHLNSRAPKLSFLIIDQNSAREVIQSVQWIMKNATDIPHEIIIFSTKGNRSDPKDLSFITPLATLVEVGCDRFSGELYNIASEIAVGRHICIVTSLGRITSSCLTTAFRSLQNDAAVKAVVLLSNTYLDQNKSKHHAINIPYNMSNLTNKILTDIALHSQSRDGKFFDLMLIDNEVFSQANGFNLAYEPGPYQDIDLITKIVSAGHVVLGLQMPSKYDEVGKPSEISALKDGDIIDLHRRKFVDRWSCLPIDIEVNLSKARKTQLAPSKRNGFTEQKKPNAVLYTPFSLTPGGGERYLLSIAALLANSHNVVLAVPHLYSRLRLRSLAEELELDLVDVEIALLADISEGPKPDLFISMDNFVVPRQAALGINNFYICQFPFPMTDPIDQHSNELVAGYQAILAYSRYAKDYIESGLANIQASNVPIFVVSPAVTQIGPSIKRANTILTVGRFFVGGHAKRHDLLIKAFKILVDQSEQELELHIAGSTIPEKQHMDYVDQLISASIGFPIHFHFNATPTVLNELYASTEFYWHGAGLEANSSQEPWAFEHFGISVVEAMSAGSIPFAVSTGGPQEIITPGINGYLYDSIEMLVENTSGLLSVSPGDRKRISRAAIKRAADFSPEVFSAKILNLIRH